MTDARVPFRATMPVQIGPCRGGDSLLEVRVRPIALQGIVVWWSLPAVYDFLRGPKHQASGVFRGGLWKVWKTFLEAAGVVLKACSQATLIREDDGLRCEFGFACACIRSLVLLLLRWCSAHAQTGRVEFLVEASKAFLSSWFGLVHGVLRVAGNGPIETTDTGVIGERMVSFSVRQGTVDLTAADGGAFEDFHRNLSALCDSQATSLLELLLAAPCLVDRLTTDFGYLPQFVWILALC